MSLLAVTDPCPSLAHAVDGLVVLARNRSGGTCVWCGSRDLDVEVCDGDALWIDVTCRECGSQLSSERPVRREPAA